MTNIERIKSMNVDELSSWLNSWKAWDEAPWEDWWNKNYCSKCESEIVEVVESKIKIPCSWCELYDKCKFFQELDDTPNSKQIIEMWLEEKYR